MKDQRRFTRKSLHCMVSVFNEAGESMGNLVDYSDGGVMVASYMAIALNETFEFSIVDIPKNMGHKRTGKITLKSVWGHQLTNTMFGTGFELIEADERAKEMFASYDDAQDD